MSPNDHAGRIPKEAFLVSSGTLLAVCLIGATVRFYIRVRIQKQFSIDDGFLIFALCCLISAMAITYAVTIDKAYLAEALTFPLADADVPPDFLQQTYDYHKWITVTLMLVWCAVMALKFSFLFLFRKLIDRIRPLIIYWYIVTTFNIAVLGFGVSVYYVSCPYYYSPKSRLCHLPKGSARTLGYSVAQTVLDVVGDLMILYIPVCLIWKINIKWTQKVVLAMSLCLTIVMIIVTIIRVSGIKRDSRIDYMWESYWLIMSAEVGIILAAATAFRAFFVARNNKEVRQPGGQKFFWYYDSKQVLKQLFSLSTWRAKSSEHSSELQKAQGEDLYDVQQQNFPMIPQAQLTGIRTFIGNHGRTRNDSAIMRSNVTEEDEAVWPLRVPMLNNIGMSPC